MFGEFYFIERVVMIGGTCAELSQAAAGLLGGTLRQLPLDGLAPTELSAPLVKATFESSGAPLVVEYDADERAAVFIGDMRKLAQELDLHVIENGAEVVEMRGWHFHFELLDIPTAGDEKIRYKPVRTGSVRATEVMWCGPNL